MSNIVYTREVESDAIIDSTLVDEVYYNENTKELYVDLYGSVYKYSDVLPATVDEFENAYSAGNFYNTQIKGKFPSQNLGSWRLLTPYEEVDVVKPVTLSGPISSKGSGVISVSSDGTATLPSVSESVLGQTDKIVSTRQIPTFSLKPFSEPVATVEGVERDYALTFEVEGLTGKKVHRLKSTSVDEAVNTVTYLGKSLDLTFVVREVVITL